MPEVLKTTDVLVVGAGVMGIGIVQVAAQSGYSVLLYDICADTVVKAIEDLSLMFNKLISKGKMTQQSAEDSLARIQPVSSLSEVTSCKLVVEAIVENLEIKRNLFLELDGFVPTDCIFATNTSSISITAIANGLNHPERLVGMHFFNPVPLMNLVEVVSGLQTSVETADRIFQISRDWGKHPVHTRSTPGFIVNRIARPFYAESLELLHQCATTPETLDTCVRGAGFKMGPCELMDLIGHDTNFAVTTSVYQSNFADKRYKPSLVQKELVEGGMLGRKSGQGFYTYPREAVAGNPNQKNRGVPRSEKTVTVHGDCFVTQRFKQALNDANISYSVASDSDWVGLKVDGNQQLRLTDGECASAKGNNVALFDLPLLEPSLEHVTALAISFSSRIIDVWRDESLQWLRFFGFEPYIVADLPGLIVARTVAMIINEAADAVHQNVCSPDAADSAMKLGVSYPRGPFEWLAQWGAGRVVQTLDALADFYRSERYRVSPWLRHLVWQQAV